MPKGFTDSINKARKAFEDLKKESLITGKNLATKTLIAKKSNTSRNNLYILRNSDWKNLVQDIEDFEKEFDTLTSGKYKNPQIEKHVQLSKAYEKQYKEMAEQNLNLLDKINNLEMIIMTKEQTIKSLERKLGNKYGK